jgi:quercetin dioxygenase-like cupin family protein
MDLPNGVLDAERLYGGQKFVRHVAEGIVKKVSGGAFRDWLERDTGIGKATAGLASVVVRRPSPSRVPLKHSGELLFWFVLEGAVQLRRGKSVNRLESGDSVAIPPDMEISALGARTGTEILEVRFPAVAL